ncbi:glyoxylase-like metal-dependent hydrolase (beta-lactamase superfamily II) [Sphaerotilus hippei]|uniref:Glyoxylase-like metal-dependent hydrolase (Beta-lactamase superfamily II) n=1 Tax=Sphaerotilus hippei TaxID=744406 RepID=A0A318HGS0_9BURK|nr:MBL fold metallo-hydrolase [Sphaerotilus hippei]PXW99243.1 glyoxylase-like metal-dependent hydrolase (beta-lactamase superfamily II) [Sphaerotilus hippei]
MANPNEHQLSYPLGDTLPERGQLLEVAPGVLWVRMGLPFALDHINLWLLRDRQDGIEGWTIVDCGVTNDSTQSAWERIFAEALDGLPVLRLIVTHMHPDHIGLAHWLTQRWSLDGRTCRLWISGSDWNAARMASQQTTGFGGEAAAAFFASHGLIDPAAQAKVRARGNYYASMVPQVPGQYRRLLDGQAVDVGSRSWRCLVGYGHAPEHISLHSPDLGVLISGDMLLPRISTNVSVIDLEPEGNPLPLYLASLDRLRVLPADTLVLPSHGKPFRGLHERVAQLHAHHEERLADLLAACQASPCSAADALPVLFRRELDLHQTTFAMGEAVAHLNALWHRGLLRRERDAAGVWRFSLA